MLRNRSGVVPDLGNNAFDVCPIGVDSFDRLEHPAKGIIPTPGSTSKVGGANIQMK